MTFATLRYQEFGREIQSQFVRNTYQRAGDKYKVRLWEIQFNGPMPWCWFGQKYTGNQKLQCKCKHRYTNSKTQIQIQRQIQIQTQIQIRSDHGDRTIVPEIKFWWILPFTECKSAPPFRSYDSLNILYWGPSVWLEASQQMKNWKNLNFW